MKDKKILITFIFFILAMVLGWFLRLYLVYPTEFIKYKHLIHAHSHVILLGWAFNALYISINAIYHPKDSTKYRKFIVLFWAIQTTIVLAMIGFLIEGYAFFSIFFSTLFLLGTFIWIAWIWRDVKMDKSLGSRFISLALFFLLISSLGPLSLGAIMSTSLKTTPAYPLSIYFYLHFLYNGFLIFGLFGVWLKYLDKKKISYNEGYARNFYNGMKWSIIPLYTPSAVWLNASIWINLIGAGAALIQIWAGINLFKMVVGMKNKSMMNKDVEISIHSILLQIVGVVFGIKLILQFLSSIEWISNVALQTKNFLIIGYIHLIMLGLISVFILWYFIAQNWLSINNKLSKLGIWLFILGIFLSEILLFTQGCLAIFKFGQIPSYSHLLLWASVLMPLGIILLVRGQYMKDS